MLSDSQRLLLDDQNVDNQVFVCKQPQIWLHESTPLSFSDHDLIVNDTTNYDLISMLICENDFQNATCSSTINESVPMLLCSSYDTSTNMDLIVNKPLSLNPLANLFVPQSSAISTQCNLEVAASTHEPQLPSDATTTIITTPNIS